MKKTVLFVLAVIFLSAVVQSCHKDNNSNRVIKVYNVSGLFSLTGNGSTLGVNSKAAVSIAVTDINNYLTAKNADFRMSADFYDTQFEPATAAQDFMKAAAGGTHYIIGPQTSAELGAINTKADSDNVIVVSQGSTASTLAIAGDAVFRFCPPDNVEGAAIANSIYKAGVRGLVTIARNDAGNLGLQTATGSSFTTLGGHISALAAYSTTAADFTAQIALLHSQVTQLAATYGMANVAIYLASFEECTQLFQQAATDPVIGKVRWYGGDGAVLSAALTADPTAADFAIATSFYAPTFGLPAALKAKWQPISNLVMAATNIQPDAFALSTYDAMWVIEKTIEVSENKNVTFDQLKANFAAQANAYTGITGPTALDKNGDRAGGVFDYYGLLKTGSAYSWMLVGQSGN
jgi:branched-chain amino acid transport system substrate-binding protein